MFKVLYSGGGSQEFEIAEEVDQKEKRIWPKEKQQIVQILESRKSYKAAEILKNNPFQLYIGTNYFGDDFYVLLVEVSIDEYIKTPTEDERNLYHQIVDTFNQQGRYIRFIAKGLIEDQNHVNIELSQNGVYTSHAVMEALEDAQSLLADRGASSAVDRVHTALHGYLKNITKDSSDSITKLFKVLRETNNTFSIEKEDDKIRQILNSLANCIDVINKMRNNHSLAHPNESLLKESEARLMINCTKTIYQYINDKVDSEVEIDNNIFNK